MPVKLLILLYFCCFFLGSAVYAQEFGGNPPSLKWSQIDTDTVRIIFPSPVRWQGERVASIVHYLSKHAQRSVGERFRKIDIVLQNQTIFSNGYVGLAPFRSELYMNEPQNTFDLGANWLDMLSIHEYRHAQQFMNTRQGLIKVGYVLTGEFGWSYLSSLSIPDWFWEGDAVVSETALTAQGRGRIPSFYNGYRSMLFDDKNYNYQKARNGSLKDYVPNHYELGYLMCTYGRENYENDFWKSILTDASRYKGLFYPFSGALKRKTGKSVTQFYGDAMSFYSQKWDADNTSISNANAINRVEKKRTFTSYEYPQSLGEGRMLVNRVSFDRIGGFYLIDQDGREMRIKNRGRVVDNYFSYRNNKLVWAEVGQDPRWTWVTFSNIVLLDLQTKKRTRLQTSKRYFSPDISPDGSKIVAFHVQPDLTYGLHIISADNGEILQELRNKENYYYSYPKWTLDGRHILAIARDRMGKIALVKLAVDDSSVEVLVPFTNHQMGIPFETEDHIFFSASFSGVDNIFAYSKETGVIQQVTNEKLGAYQAHVDSDMRTLFYSEFSTMGNNIKSVKIDPGDWEEVEVIEPAVMPQYNFRAVAEEGGDITQKVGNRNFPVSRYPAFSKLVNLHSWSFYFQDPNYEWALRSNNILNTLDMSLGIRYNRNDQHFTYFFDASYAKYYPVLNLSASLGQRNTVAPLVDGDGNVVGTANIRWWESIVRPGVSIPFQLGSGLYSRQLVVGGYYSYTNVNFNEESEAISPDIQDFDYQSVTPFITFINRRKKARKNIFAKYSQYLQVSYDRLIDREVVDQFFADVEITFPGISPNHNLVFQGMYQREDPEKFPRFGDNFVYARGYNRPFYDQIYKVGTNYHLPIFYPDWGFWGILYLYRLRANAFFDYSRAHYTPSDSNRELIQLYNSVGGELVLDARVLNMYDFSFGFRYSYLLNEDPRQAGLKNSFEFFLPVMRF